MINISKCARWSLEYPCLRPCPGVPLLSSPASRTSPWGRLGTAADLLWTTPRHWGSCQLGRRRTPGWLLSTLCSQETSWCKTHCRKMEICGFGRYNVESESPIPLLHDYHIRGSLLHKIDCISLFSMNYYYLLLLITSSFSKKAIMKYWKVGTTECFCSHYNSIIRASTIVDDQHSVEALSTQKYLESRS